MLIPKREALGWEAGARDAEGELSVNPRALSGLKRE